VIKVLINVHLLAKELCERYNIFREDVQLNYMPFNPTLEHTPERYNERWMELCTGLQLVRM